MAAFDEGRHAQAFPSFGPERTGAPVVAFCRISDQPIRVREPVVAPDAVVLQDATLLHQVDVFQGMTADAYVLINSTHTLGELGLGSLATRVAPQYSGPGAATHPRDRPGGGGASCGAGTATTGGSACVRQ